MLRALLSVSDKRGIVPFAKQLIEKGYEIVSTGGTASALREAKIPVTSVEDITSFPECFGGRVKTMHPLIMGGILYRRGDADHERQAKELGIQPIDLVVVNLYPFQETVERSKQEATLADPAIAQEIMEQIDIGGPTLLRSAAKNYESVMVVCDPDDYDRVLQALADDHDRDAMAWRLYRRELAAKAFAHTCEYDGLIAGYLSDGTFANLPLHNGRTLRYGENPHQWGKFYAMASVQTPWHGVSNNATFWHQLQGKELSYLNILDADAAWAMACDFSAPTAVFVKHANSSGIASHESIEEAFQRAYDTDRLSAFGVIIALNRECTPTIARKIIDQKIFTELILAPSFAKEAVEILKQKPNIRAISCQLSAVSTSQAPAGSRKLEAGSSISYRSAFGGMLVQNVDRREVTEKDIQLATSAKPTPEQISDLLFAWKVAKHAKSNAIVLAKDHVTVGIGAGQTSRVDATWIALKRAGERARGSVLASDAFFPFPDSLQEAAKHGISAVIQPGGSIRDAEVIAEADRLGIAMAFTGVRAFRH